MKKPTIDQYLISTCLNIIDDMNETYGQLSKADLKRIADVKFCEMDITVKIGYPFRQLCHFTNTDNGKKNSDYKNNHDLLIESKDFQIEVKYLKNWPSNSGTYSVSATWDPYQKDFNWIVDEVKNNQGRRAFVIGWFNCVDHFPQLIQLGSGRGSRPIVNEERFAYFPFLRKIKTPTHTDEVEYDYDCAYESLKLNLIGNTTTNCRCLFVGNSEDVFHFAIYY